MSAASTTTRPRVFVDVGAHDGSSIAAVLEGGYKFDRMISAEPDPDMVARVEQRFAGEIAAGHYVVAPVGLSDKNSSARLYGDNALGGASVIESKFATDNRAAKEIQLIDWPTFLERYGLKDARLWIKINAEGAEIAILDSILAEGGRNIESLVVYFDIVKSPFGAWKKWRMLKALKASRIQYFTSEEILVKHGPRPRLHNWLSSFAELKEPPLTPVPAPLSKLVRMHYLDFISAIGIRLDIFKRAR